MTANSGDRKPVPFLTLSLAIAVAVLITLVSLPGLSLPPGQGLPSAGEVPSSWAVADPRIQEMLLQVNKGNLSRTTDDLAGLGTRYVGTGGNGQAATYLHNRLSSIPGLRVRYQDDRFRNVIGTLPGEGSASAEAIVVGAHYDSISPDPLHAPGATDNACGVAIVLEQARVMSRYRFNRTLVFAFWNAEETGGGGSRSYAKEAVGEGLIIPLYLNYDSSCYDPGNRSVIDLMYDGSSREYAALAVASNSLYGVNATLTSNLHRCEADYLPFRDLGYPWVMTHSESHGPGHGEGDTLDKASFAYAGMNARLGLATLVRVAGVD